MKKDNTKNYQGKIYTFKENTLEKIQTKYHATFLFLLIQVLEQKKYLKQFETKLKFKENDSSLINDLTLTIIEETGKELNLSKDKIYSYKKYHNKLKKELKKYLKLEKRTKEKSSISIINNYKNILNKDYKTLRKLALRKPHDFLKVLYLYTICED